MKPVHIGILVLVGAMGGALIMKFSQREAPGIVPAPIVAPAPVVAPVVAPLVPPIVAPPHIAAETAAESTPAAEPAAPPLPKKALVTRVHRVKPAPQAVTTVAQNLPPAPEASVPEPSVPEPSAPEPIQEPQAPAAEVAPPPAPVPQPAPSVTLRAGMLLPVRLGETLSSDHNQAGDTFTATLDGPLVVDDFVIAERGARVEGRVVEAQKASHVKGQSSLALELTRLNTSDGQHVGIQTDSFRKQGATTSTDQNVGIVAAAAGVGAIIGAMAGGGKGAGIGAAAGGAAGTGGVIATRAKPVALASETKISFRLSQTVTITEQLNR